MNIIQKFRNRSREAGASLLEVMVGTALFSMVIVLSLPVFANLTQITVNMVNKEDGTNQGVVVDQANDLYRAAKDFKTDYPDCEASRTNMEHYGYVPNTITNDLHWGVGQSQRYADNTVTTMGKCDGSPVRKSLMDSAKVEVCVVAYSTINQTDVYTASTPAEVNASGYGVGLFSNGCRTYKEDGSWGFVTD
jgi:hypothetical protein